MGTKPDPGAFTPFMKTTWGTVIGKLSIKLYMLASKAKGPTVKPIWNTRWTDVKTTWPK